MSVGTAVDSSHCWGNSSLFQIELYIFGTQNILFYFLLLSFLLEFDAYLMTCMLSNWQNWFCHVLKVLWESGRRQPFCIHYQDSARLATLLKIIYAFISLWHSYSCCLLQAYEFNFSGIPFLLFEMNTVFKACTLFSSCMLLWLGSCNCVFLHCSVHLCKCGMYPVYLHFGSLPVLLKVLPFVVSNHVLC